MKSLNIVELHAVAGGLDPAIANKPIGSLTINEIGEILTFLNTASNKEIRTVFPWTDDL